MPKAKAKHQSFADRVRAVVRDIPRGQVMTYGEVAKKAGVPKGARAVGTLMKGNYTKDIPCHRVVRSDGAVGEYNRGGSTAKTKLLRREGVAFRGTRVVVKKRS